MIVTIHQPNFMPWLGYLQRMAQADLFVVLDHVQFERANYQNRARILSDGEPRWMTVPVLQRSQKERILDKEVDNARRWGASMVSTLRHAYRDSPEAGPLARELRGLLEAPWTRLADLNLACIGFLRDAFGIRTPMVKSSELPVSGAKSELVLSICRAAGATTFLGGMGGSRDYLDRDAFAQAGIAVRWQQFRHPEYAQCGARGAFTPGLSALDLLFNRGAGARAVLFPRTLKEEALAAA